MAASEPKLSIYTDGAARGNPGRGGYGAVLVCDVDGKRAVKELRQGYTNTTNNRMELMGVIAALEALKRPTSATVFSDSQYVVNAHTQNWLENWQKRGWKGADKKLIKNVDLWQRLLVAEKPHILNFVWVKGHAGDPLNERCDELATMAADLGPFVDDSGFEPQQSLLG